MKLGISYNVFDGEEVLEHSLRSVRPVAAYISAVYQLTSNYGNPASPDLLPTLQRLRARGLIDELELFEPDLGKGPSFLETEKRNVGLMLSRARLCTHHMSIDCDELYVTDQLARALAAVERDGAWAGYCNMDNYYRATRYVILPPSRDFHVPFVYKVERRLKYTPCADTGPGIVTDPTRGMAIPPDRSRVCPPAELTMHHLSYVRRSLRAKLENSSSRPFHAQYIDKMIACFAAWKYPEPALVLTGKPEDPVRFADICEVPDLFGVGFERP